MISPALTNRNMSFLDLAKNLSEYVQSSENAVLDEITLTFAKPLSFNCLRLTYQKETGNFKLESFEMDTSVGLVEFSGDISIVIIFDTLQTMIVEMKRVG